MTAHTYQSVGLILHFIICNNNTLPYDILPYDTLPYDTLPYDTLPYDTL